MYVSYLNIEISCYKQFLAITLSMAFVWCNIVSAAMQCHDQCNETYRCWGPADTDCVVCNVYLYRNGSERICVDSCDSPRLNL